MDIKTYEFITGGSAFVITILGIMLATTTISPESRLDKLRKARNILVPSYFILALLSLTCCLTGYDRNIEFASTLFVASFQALLFTVSMLIFIRPGEVRWKTVLRQAGGITVAGIALFAALFCFADYYLHFLYAGITAYIIQLIIYTRKFMLAYRKTVQEIEDYYDEDEENRLRWVKVGFYSALIIGIMALFILFFPELYKFFVPLYVIFYSFMVMWFVNYHRKMLFAIPIITTASQEALPLPNEPDTGIKSGKEPEDKSIPAEIERMLRERLQQYIDAKEYCRKDVPTEEIAASLGTTVPLLRKYMTTHHAMWFSTWRNELRIREACTLYQENPDIPIMDMTEKIGYTDNGNFCRNFKKIVGVTPKEYCARIRSGIQ